MFDYTHRIRSSSFCGNKLSCNSFSFLDQLVPFSASALASWEHAQQHLLVAFSDARVVLVVALRLQEALA